MKRRSYVGSGVAASACAMDKIISKQIFRSYRLPVAKDIVLHRGRVTKRTTAQVLDELGNEVVVKPGAQGSAVGVTFANNANRLLTALEEAFQYGERVLVEERIHGKEVTVAILERDGTEALPVIEIRTPPGSWYDYEHRYAPGLSEHIIPAPLPEAQYRRTQEVAKEAHESLGCRDLSRVDFVVPEQGEPILIEINTMPELTVTFKVIPSSMELNDRVYVTGNHSTLGNWQPAGVPLEQQEDGSWTKTFEFKQGTHLEFKVTLGIWEREALTEDETVPPNSVLDVARDTTLVIPVPAWK